VSNPRRHEAKKSLGQNFLVSKEVARSIVRAAGVGEGDLALEIGPGHGALTVPLAETGARIVAFELDRFLVDELRSRFIGMSGVEIIEGDIREVDPDREAELRGYEGYTMLGNIPYNLTSTILLSLPRLRLCRAAYLMVQREVGERIAAVPGERSCGILSVFLQSYMNVERIIRVRAGSFRPKPKVESIVLGFTPEEAARGPADREAFLGFLKGAFSQRRKKLSSIFRDVFGMRDAGDVLRLGRMSNADMGGRPEELSLEQWQRLFDGYQQVSGT
jgi:16S rRNA (adenine1518-N6/adenine1519-N6)-dimethyltransferase